MAKDDQHVFIARRRNVLHVGADGGAEDTNRGKGAKAGDVIDGAQRVTQGFDAGNNFTRNGSLAHAPGRVFQGAEKGLLAHEFLFAGKVAGEIDGVVELIAKAEVVRAQINQTVVFPKIEGGNQLQSHQSADARFDGLQIGSRNI